MGNATPFMSRCSFIFSAHFSLNSRSVLEFDWRQSIFGTHHHCKHRSVERRSGVLVCSTGVWLSLRYGLVRMLVQLSVDVSALYENSVFMKPALRTNGDSMEYGGWHQIARSLEWLVSSRAFLWDCDRAGAHPCHQICNSKLIVAKRRKG